MRKDTKIWVSYISTRSLKSKNAPHSDNNILMDKYERFYLVQLNIDLTVD